ncbi:MAG TPA: NADH-quinone oxidoreductase subunit NuoF [Candidatus Sumerlaeota bacterium]|nr:NADH-quinone oxidoreductase subunit NuoF [Candidatus Sumerlaeota bacterium]HOR26658.1 NADH-quinone oxidoreductase subunit NuoF [Candidatus Sumerlaeota bacterium]
MATAAIQNYSPILTAGVTGTVYSGSVESLTDYQARGGYDGYKRALQEQTPDDVLALVKEANIRGRGGAGFPAGVKWGFIPRNRNLPHYVCVNADESEPGTFSNRPILEQRPHLLLEGAALAAYATLAETVYIYIRKEYYEGVRQTQRAIDDAYAAGLLGRNILGTGFNLDIHVHTGAGAYICGEETALIESLEGKRGYPRLRPPFPAVQGLYNCPTVINNVETLAIVAEVARRGGDWFKSLGTEKSPGMTVYSISGHVRKPGNYELPLGVTMRELIYEHAGGIRDGNKFKAVFPGGSSVPMLFEDELDVVMDFDGPRQYGTFLGSTGIIVMDETVCLVWAALNLMHFYWDESCGQCTPCREGTGWMHKILKRLEHGQGVQHDVDLLLDICKNIVGRSICALGEFSTGSLVRTIPRFRDEFQAHVDQQGCPFEKKYTEFR